MRNLVLLLAITALALCLPAQSTPGAETAVKEVKVGFIYESPVGEEGYSYAHDQGRRALATLPGVTTTYVEGVPEGPDFERIAQKMARQGYDIIFGNSYGYMDPMMHVAARFPEVHFLHCSGYKSAPNMSNYFVRIYQARYLTGLVAGSMSKKNRIGYVAAFPIPEVIRGINAFTLGARAVNPQIEVRVVWTKTWSDPLLEKEAAKSLLDVGADVIAHHQDTVASQEAAEERGAFSIGYNSDASAAVPKSCLTSAIFLWGGLYKNIVEQIRAGTWQHGSYWYGMESGALDIAPYGPMVPQEVRALTDRARADIKSGAFTVFSGPVRDQEGRVRIPAGTVPTDQELLSMDWFVEGVVGTAR